MFGNVVLLIEELEKEYIRSNVMQGRITIRP